MKSEFHNFPKNPSSLGDSVALERVRSALNHLSPETREVWVRQAMAIKSGLGEDGFEMWDQWSTGSSAYRAKDARDVWKSVKAGKGITIASLFYDAKLEGWKDDTPYKKPSAAEIEQRRKERAERNAIAAAQELAAQEAAALKAQELWAAAAPRESHAYLERKGVLSHGLRFGRFEIEKVEVVTGEVEVLGMKALLMPIMDRSGKIWTLQAFSAKPDGRKSLLKNGRKSSNFFIVGSKPLLVEGRPVFILVEGYATGASVHEATGHQVLVCVDAGNLLPVAKAVQVDSPNAMIVFAADNDVGTEGNPGLTQARKAADAVGGVVAFPPWPERVHDSTGEEQAEVGLTDFNDWHQKFGLAAVAEVISKALTDVKNAAINPANTVMPQSDGEHDLGIIVLGVQGRNCAFWRQDTRTIELISPADLGKKSILYTLADAQKWEIWAGGSFNCSAAANFLINSAKQLGPVRLERVPPDECSPKLVRFQFCRAQVLTSRSPAASVVAELISLEQQCDGLIRWDRFADQPVCSRDTTWGAHKGPWTDSHDAALGAYLQDYCGLNVSVVTVRAAVNLLARKNGFHPVADYLNGLRWDGVARLDTWLIDSAGVTDSPYVRAVSSKTLIGAIARALQPGCKFDNVLCLEGRQGTGKSSLLRALMPEPKWFAEDLGGIIGNKDALLGLTGKWMLEFAEFAAVKKSTNDDVKSFLTRQVDHYRAPYGTRAEDHPRKCFFVVTINPGADGAWLSDSTGGRRFWPVRVERCDVALLKAAREQIWAEAMHRYLQGEPWHLSAEFEEMAALEQADRLDSNVWDELLARYLTSEPHLQEVVLIDVFWHAHQRPPKSNRELTPIAQAMRDRGWVESRVGKKPRKRAWRPADCEPPI